MGKGIPKAHLRGSLISGKASITPSEHSDYILFSFRYLDRRQGQSFGDWQNDGLLAQALEVFHGYSSQRLAEAFSDRFKTYDRFPERSDFSHPAHVPEDARWISMHIQGKPCVIGHLDRNIFYVVFLDKEHCFYKTDLQAR